MYRPVLQRLLWKFTTFFILSLEHRCNVACVSLFYRYYNGFCANKIRSLISENHVFLPNTHLSRRTHPYVVDRPVNRILHYGNNSLFSRIIRMLNTLREVVAIFWVLRDEKDIKYWKSHHRVFANNLKI